LGNFYPRHELNLNVVLASDENIEAFKKSGRLYEKVDLYQFVRLTEVKFHQTIDLLKPTSFYVKHLILGEVTMGKMWIVRILKQLPNLKELELLQLSSIGSNQEIQQSDAVISLPKLENIIIH
jgi:hypothetical protein